jgi:hypothetical protein
LIATTLPKVGEKGSCRRVVPLLLFASAEARTSLFLAGAHRAPVAAFYQ